MPERAFVSLKVPLVMGCRSPAVMPATWGIDVVSALDAYATALQIWNRSRCGSAKPQILGEARVYNVQVVVIWCRI